MPTRATPQTNAVWEMVAASPSKIVCVTVPRPAMIKVAVVVLLWSG
jgi:hypothetical protein